MLLFSVPHFSSTCQGNLQRATGSGDLDIHRGRFRLCGGGHELGIDQATLPRFERDRAVIVGAEVAWVSSNVDERNGTDDHVDGAIVGHGHIMVGAKPDPGIPEIDTARRNGDGVWDTGRGPRRNRRLPRRALRLVRLPGARDEVADTRQDARGRSRARLIAARSAWRRCRCADSVDVGTCGRWNARGLP